MNGKIVSLSKNAFISMFPSAICTYTPSVILSFYL